MSLHFQRAIIVGGSSGMGAEIARQLAATLSDEHHRIASDFIAQQKRNQKT